MSDMCFRGRCAWHRCVLEEGYMAQMCFRRGLYGTVNVCIYMLQRRRVYMARSMLECVLGKGAYGKSSVGIDVFQRECIWQGQCQNRYVFQRRVYMASPVLAYMCFIGGCIWQDQCWHRCILEQGVYGKSSVGIDVFQRRVYMARSVLAYICFRGGR